jgi:hypothetical protein
VDSVGPGGKVPGNTVHGLVPGACSGIESCVNQQTFPGLAWVGWLVLGTWGLEHGTPWWLCPEGTHSPRTKAITTQARGTPRVNVGARRRQEGLEWLPPLSSWPQPGPGLRLPRASVHPGARWTRWSLYGHLCEARHAGDHTRDRTAQDTLPVFSCLRNHLNTAGFIVTRGF